MMAVLLALPAPAPASEEGFPRLQPIDQLLSATEGARLTEATGTDLRSRAVALGARAQALRARTVLDPDTRARIEAVRALPRD